MQKRRKEECPHLIGTLPDIDNENVRIFMYANDVAYLNTLPFYVIENNFDNFPYCPLCGQENNYEITGDLEEE